MALGDLSVLEQEEAALARVLLKHDLLKEEDMNRFLAYREKRHAAGKKYIGGELIGLGYVTQADLDAYVKENKDTHAAFLRKLSDEGYLTPEQFALVQRHAQETGGDVVTVINDLNIMTRENYIRFFNNREPILRMGEWLVVKKKITQEQLDHAMRSQSVNSLDDYLKFHNLVNAEVVDKIKQKLVETYD